MATTKQELTLMLLLLGVDVAQRWLCWLHSQSVTLTFNIVLFYLSLANKYAWTHLPNRTDGWMEGTHAPVSPPIACRRQRRIWLPYACVWSFLATRHCLSLQRFDECFNFICLEFRPISTFVSFVFCFASADSIQIRHSNNCHWIKVQDRILTRKWRKREAITLRFWNRWPFSDSMASFNSGISPTSDANRWVISRESTSKNPSRSESLGFSVGQQSVYRQFDNKPAWVSKRSLQLDIFCGDFEIVSAWTW